MRNSRCSVKISLQFLKYSVSNDSVHSSSWKMWSIHDALKDPFSKSHERRADQFLEFAYNLALWDISWGKLALPHILGLGPPIWAWDHPLGFGLQCNSAWFATLPIFSPFWFIHEWWKILKFGSVTPNGVEVLLIMPFGQNQLCLQKFLQTDLKLKISH